jgi:hypothetical protein
MNFENKLALTTKKYWYSNTEAKPYYASLAEIYGFKIKYARNVKSELAHFHAHAERMNLNGRIMSNLSSWDEINSGTKDNELKVVFRWEDLRYLISSYDEYVNKGEIDLECLQYEAEIYGPVKNLDLVEIDEKAYNNLCKAQKSADLIKDQNLSELAESYLKNAPTDTLEKLATVDTKKQEKNGLNDFIQLILNICIIYTLGLLLLTVVHLNSNPISDDLLKISMEDKYSEIHKAARDYTVNNSSVRLQTTRILCLSTTKEFNDRLFDKADNNACDYLKKNESVESLLNLDEVQGSAYENNRSGLLDFILLSLKILAIFYSVRWFFKAIGESSK